ncbi:MAG: fatty acid--CoA ligase family protein [Pirellulaceae bacterium]|nr:fatty acid--CoA ligase family protein [Pirellulaceae bacterium]
MLSNVLNNTASTDNREAIHTVSSSVSWAALKSQYQHHLEQFTGIRGQRVGFALPATANGIAALAAFEQLRVHLFLVDALTGPQHLQQIADELQLSDMITAETLTRNATVSRVPEEALAKGASDLGSITILTSGTSGRPKAVQHHFDNLARPVRRRGDQEQRWLMAYRPHLYAGLQVTLQALLNQGTLVIPAVDASPQAVANLMLDANVEYASATPSYWRRLLLFADPSDLRRVPMKQITLGGEAIDQSILDQLSQSFPTARIVHIYATTEAGRCFSVSDGIAGFPTAFLDAPSADGVELKITDGELCVRSANAMARYDERSELLENRQTTDGWFRTGDLVEIEGERAFFVGRSTDMINVGGNKVHPVEIEQVIRARDDVAEVRIYAQSSSIAGELVACDVVPIPSKTDFEEFRQAIVEHCNAQLNRFQRPRIVRILKELELNDSGKMKRI